MVRIQAMKQTMFDTFEIKGYWWIPENKANQIAGMLFFSGDDIYLELIGSLGDDNFFSSGNEKYEVIHGYSDVGEQLTLLDVTIRNTQINAPGFQTQTYSIHSFMVGDYFTNKEEMQFHSFTFFPTYLTEWLSRTVFTDGYVLSKEKKTFVGKQVSYNQFETFKHYVSNLEATIEETHITNYRRTDRSKEVYWTNKSGIKVVPNEYKDLSWYLTNMHLLKDLINLFIGHATYFEKITFYGEEISYEEEQESFMERKKYSYFYKQNKSKLKEKIGWLDIIVPFKNIEKDLDAILNHWFDKHNELKIVYDLHFAELYKDIYINTTFLNTVQVLEIYHRKMYKGKVYDKNEYRTLLVDLKKILTNDFPPKFADLISSKVDYGNEYSLAMRIQEILDGFEDNTKNTLIGTDENIKKFIRQIVETRNYLTHYDSDKKKNILKNSLDKYFAIQRLRAIATLILFKEVGLDEKIMVNQIGNSKHYSYGLNEAKKVLN